jgi:hypothetical protein
LLKIRSKAIELAGGDEVWDELDDDQIYGYMSKAADLVS